MKDEEKLRNRLRLEKNEEKWQVNVVRGTKFKPGPWDSR